MFCSVYIPGFHHLARIIPFLLFFSPSLCVYPSGASFANLFDVVNNFALFDAFVMLGADTLLYLVAAWYIDRVAPTEGQTPAHWLFCLRASFWCPDACGKNSGSVSDDEDADRITAAIVTASSARSSASSSAASSSFIEPVAADIAARPGVHLRGLTKWFEGAAAPSVAHLDMQCYEGQIFVLLGAGGV